MINCLWLPGIFECYDFTKWNDYLKELYKIFEEDFINNTIYFRNKRVNYRKYPKLEEYEHAFIHLTHVSEEKSMDPNDRIPDIKRAERLAWNKAIIENYDCRLGCEECKGIKLFEEYDHNKKKIYLWFEDMDFMVILEERKDYFLLITGFYINYDNMKKKYEKKYNNFLNAKNAIDFSVQ